MNAVGSIGANRPERRRLLVMTEETLRSSSPPTNSVIATGRGWIVPWVMSRRSTALAGRAPRNAAAAAPLAVASKRRRDHGTTMECYLGLGFIVIVIWRGSASRRRTFRAGRR